MIKRIMEIMSVPIRVMSWTTGIISGVWLAILGEWELILIALPILFLSKHLLSLIMIPSMAALEIGATLFERKNPFGIIFLYISHFYSNFFIIIVCFFSISFCSAFAELTLDKLNVDNFIGFIPYLLWSWSIVFIPLQYFATDEDNEFSFFTIYSASIFYFLFISLINFSENWSSFIFFLFAIFHLIVLPIYYIYSAYQLREQDK